MKNPLFPMTGLACALALLSCGPATDNASRPASKPSPGPAKAEQAAEARLADFLKTLKLTGQPVFIEFGMVGCELSDKGLNAMVKLQRKPGLKGLAFVRVESARDRSAADAYYQDKSLPFPVHFDPEGTLAFAADATAIPTFLLVDRFGHVRYRGMYPEQVVPWATALIAEASDPGPQVALFGAKDLDIKRLLAETQLPDLKGVAQPLVRYMGTNGLVVVFVDTKCPYSVKAMGEMPSVVGILQKHRIGSVLLNVDDPKATVQSFYANRNVGASVVYDAGSATRKNWNVHSVPTVMLIKRDQALCYSGKAVWKNLGDAMEKSMGLATGSVQFPVKGTGFG